MDSKHRRLAVMGFEIVWTNGTLCRACRDGRDVLLRWEEDEWLVL